MKLPTVKRTFIVSQELYATAHELGYDTSAEINEYTLRAEFHIHCTAEEYAVLNQLAKEL